MDYGVGIMGVGEAEMQRRIKVIVQKTEDGYVAYPLGVKGVVVGDGDTFEEALENAKSAINFHPRTFGDEVLAQVVAAEDIYGE
jgi:predicted RNase H-like HicB family nuclease